MSKTTKKTIKEPVVIIRIVSCKATEHQMKLLRTWQTRLIASVREELESEANGD